MPIGVRMRNFKPKRKMGRVNNHSALNAVSKENDKSIIIGFLVNNPDIAELASKTSDNPETPLHMTLMYLGDDMGELDRAAIESILQQFATEQAPIEGRYNGAAIFAPKPDENKYAIVLLYDSPQLPALIDRLWSAFDGIRPDANHGFTAHTTLAYSDNPADMPHNFQITYQAFDAITLFWGNEYINYPLTGVIIEKGGAGSGNYGHAGRPGKVGGSARGAVAEPRLPGYGNVVDTYEDLRGSIDNTTSYVIAPTKQLYDTYNVDHSDGARAYFEDHPGEFEAIQAKFDKIHPGWTLGSLDALLEVGGVRVRAWYSHLYIHTGDRTPATLRKLHKYADMGLLHLDGIRTISWDTSGFGLNATTITSPVIDFLTAKSTATLADDTIVYRQIKTRNTKILLKLPAERVGAASNE